MKKRQSRGREHFDATPLKLQVQERKNCSIFFAAVQKNELIQVKIKRLKAGTLKLSG